MIVYGTRSKELAKEIISDKCPNCGTQHSIDMHVFQKYAHIFWIPVFPIGKTGVSQCDQCKQVLKLNQMPEPLKNTYENLKSQAKTPVWTFSGLAVFAGLIIIAFISGRQKDEKNAKLILTPHKGDVFDIKTKNNQYTTYKVEEVQGDSVFIRTNNYETNKETGIAELKEKGDSAYSEDIYGFSKKELKQMVDKGEIIDISTK